MLHSIGRKAESENIVDLLLACHGRIRMFLTLAKAIAEPDAGGREEIVEATERIRRYFLVALPLHVEDEEQGVVPRLQDRSPGLDAALDRMCDEHAEHVAPLRVLLASCDSLAAAPGDARARAALSRAAEVLGDALEPHLAAEESVVFPAIRALLTDEEQRAMVIELRRRRQAP